MTGTEPLRVNRPYDGYHWCPFEQMSWKSTCPETNVPADECSSVTLCFYPLTDKSPLMNEFLSQIKSNVELSQMYESIQKDATTTTSETSLMDIS